MTGMAINCFTERILVTGEKSRQPPVLFCDCFAQQSGGRDAGHQEENGIPLSFHFFGSLFATGLKLLLNDYHKFCESFCCQWDEDEENSFCSNHAYNGMAFRMYGRSCL